MAVIISFCSTFGGIIISGIPTHFLEGGGKKTKDNYTVYSCKPLLRLSVFVTFSKMSPYTYLVFAYTHTPFFCSPLLITLGPLQCSFAIIV